MCADSAGDSLRLDERHALAEEIRMIGVEPLVGDDALNINRLCAEVYGSMFSGSRLVLFSGAILPVAHWVGGTHLVRKNPVALAAGRTTGLLVAPGMSS